MLNTYPTQFMTSNIAIFYIYLFLSCNVNVMYSML